MKTDHVTAYALGELAGSEREAFEKELASSPELQKELQEISAACDALTCVPQEDLGEKRRSRLMEEVRRNLEEGRKARSIHRKVVATSLAALAACLLVLPILQWTDPVPSAVSERLLEAKASGSLELAKDNKQVASAPAQAPVPAMPEEPQLMGKLKEITGQIAAPQAAAAPAAEAAGSAKADAIRTEAVAVSAPQPLGVVPGMGARAATLRSSEGFAGSGLSRRSDGPADTDASATTAMAGADQVKRIAPQAGGEKAGKLRDRKFNTETYDAIAENPFLEATANPLSTFSIDVDTASYSNIRRFLNDGRMPPAGAVRTEELINYFPYDYPQPEGDAPFSVEVETSRAPWAPQHELVRIGLKGREMKPETRPPSNLVFLVDVSGSMSPENKLPLLKRSLRELVARLDGRDRVSVVVYAGASGLALPPTPGSDREAILAALDHLDAGGSTNGAQGIALAYETARKNFQKDGINRVILCTDGDFNVGITDQSSLTALIEQERASGVFLSVLGFGEGNLKDSTMEKLADKGNGNYAYIDSLSEGRKVLVDQMGGTLLTIAKDVKVQIEFNPARVAAYRLIGYENRLLPREDFNDDKKDAGEIGAGHTVTALYEIVPAGARIPGSPSVDPLKYQKPGRTEDSADLLTLKLRYKAPDGETSQLITRAVPAGGPGRFESASADHRFAAAVAAFGMKLRGTPGSEAISWEEIQSAARSALGSDPGSHRAEFLTLVEKAKALAPESRNGSD